MKPLLFLSPRVPWPLNTGAKIRTGALLAALKESFAVHYAGFLQPDLTLEEARSALAGCADVTLLPEPATTPAGKAWLGVRTLADSRPATIAKYWSGGLARHAARWLADHPQGIVHADHLHMAPYLELGRPALRVVDEHNVESNIVERLADQHKGRPTYPYLRLQAARVRRLETRLARLADLVLAVSEGDAAQLAALAPRTRVEIVRNGVDLDYFQPPADGRRPRPGRLIFVGSMNWLPNQDAVVWFAREILPLLERRHPRPEGWSLDIVGQTPSRAVLDLAGGRIRVTGTVPDVRPYAREAQVFIVPLRIGGGSRLKILEAFAMGVPVVSTAVGCEGLNTEDGRHLLTADAPEAFADAVARVASDGELAATLTREAERHAREHFSWQAIGHRLNDLYLHF